MSKADIVTALSEVKGATVLDGELLSLVAGAVRQVFPMAPHPTPGAADLVEEVLHMVDICLPGWTIQLTGKAQEPDGHWRCSLRETRGSDEVEIIGLGSGPTVALALTEALVQVALLKFIN